MCPPHPHPLRCHPPPITDEDMATHEMAAEPNEDDQPMEEEFISPLPSTQSTSSYEESEDESYDESDDESYEDSNEELETVGPLIFGAVLPTRDGVRFLELLGQDEDIADDIVIRVFEYLKVKSDQHALTFVDKSTYNLLLPELYHSVTIDIARYPHNLITVMNMMHLTNVGPAFIKRVTFDGSNVLDKSKPPTGLAYLAFIVIKGLPEHRVERFDWPADFVLPELYVQNLWKSQQSLQNICIYQDTLKYKPPTMKQAFDHLFDVSALRVSVENREGLRHVYQILKEAQIHDLHLDLRNYEECSYPLSNDPLRDEVAALILRYGRLDGLHMFRESMSLTRLVLWNVDLSRSATAWLRAFRSKSLKEIELSMCKHPGRFLRGLPAFHPFIEKAKIDYGLLDADFDADMNDFLKDLAYDPDKSDESFSSDSSDSSDSSTYRSIVKPRLKHLEVHIAYAVDPCFFDEKAITAHSPSLEVLSLDFVPTSNDGSQLKIPISDALNACDTMKLRQLCIPYTAFNDPETRLSSINPVTLILTEMYDPDCYEAGQVVANDALYKLRREHKKNVKLRVFAFKVDVEPVDYFVRRQVSVMGRTQDIMVSVSYAEIRKSETEIDILEPTPIELDEEYGRM